jgi:hypothetical protein
VVAAVLVAGSEKAAAHQLSLSHSTVKHHLANARSKVGAETTAQLVWILSSRLPGPEGLAHSSATVDVDPACGADRPAPCTDGHCSRSRSDNTIGQMPAVNSHSRPGFLGSRM